MIDVSPMRRVQLDGRRDRARVDGGANLGTIYRALWDQGRAAIPGGTCGGVGIAGLALGGGFGLISRRYGLTCDAMVGLEMVDGAGRRLSADDERRPNLMWASRGGGGGNFGIVTAFEFRTVRVDRVSIFRILWPWAAITQALDAFQVWADPEGLDPRLSPVMNLKARSVGNVAAFGEFLGPVAELEALIRPLVRAASPIEVEIRRLSFIDAVDRFGGAVPGAERWTIQATLAPGERFKNTSAYQYRRFEPAALSVIRNHRADTPSPACLIEMDAYGGRVAEVADAATAFAHRQGVRAVRQPQAYWNTPAEAPAHHAWVEALRRALLPFTHGGYPNYIDRDVRDWPRFYYGRNLERLVEVKRRYDPGDVFEFPQGLARLTDDADDRRRPCPPRQSWR